MIEPRAMSPEMWKCERRRYDYSGGEVIHGNYLPLTQTTHESNWNTKTTFPLPSSNMIAIFLLFMPASWDMLNWLSHKNEYGQSEQWNWKRGLNQEAVGSGKRDSDASTLCLAHSKFRTRRSIRNTCFFQLSFDTLHQVGKNTTEVP